MLCSCCRLVFNEQSWRWNLTLTLFGGMGDFSMATENKMKCPNTSIPHDHRYGSVWSNLHVGWLELQWTCRHCFSVFIIRSTHIYDWLVKKTEQGSQLNLKCNLFASSLVFFFNHDCYLQVPLWSSCIWLGRDKLLQRSRETSSQGTIHDNTCTSMDLPVKQFALRSWSWALGQTRFHPTFTVCVQDVNVHMPYVALDLISILLPSSAI